MNSMHRSTGILIAVLICTQLSAQEIWETRTDSLGKVLAGLSKTTQLLKKVRISGYIQTQFQAADTLGARSFNGGDFAKSSSHRFQVRRAYFKMAYAGDLSTYVLQFNVNERGFSIRDAYFSIREPWLKAISLTAGIFYRPFGCELPYPTHKRETPELARITQTLFPGERDLGASISFQMPQKSRLEALKAEAGLFTGNGTAAETDDKLDFIGRLSWSEELRKPGINYHFGISYYHGSIYQAKKQVYQAGDIDGVTCFYQRMQDTLIGSYQLREYFGLDGSFSFKSPLGFTQVRADFMSGIQPSADTTSMSPTEKIAAPIYLRNFSGGVVYLVHTFPNPVHSLVIKYDRYDPNVKVKDDQVGLVSPGNKATAVADLAYVTWGFGYFADISRNLRLTLYYDLVKNETSRNLSKYGSDIKDNIFTIRVQYKF